MMTMKLTDTDIEQATPAAKEFHLVDGGGLRLRVLPNGRKSWALRTHTAAGVQQVTLGRYPEMTLALAREAAQQRREATQQTDHRAETHELARAWLDAGLTLFNRLRDELGRPVEVQDVVRSITARPRG